LSYLVKKIYFFYSIESKSINSTSYLGYVGKEKEISINYDLDSIPRFNRHETLISLNGSLLTPDLPEIGSTSGGFISFEAVKSIHLIFHRMIITNQFIKLEIILIPINQHFLIFAHMVIFWFLISILLLTWFTGLISIKLEIIQFSPMK
jgi:hypothetical protein